MSFQIHQSQGGYEISHITAVIGRRHHFQRMNISYIGEQLFWGKAGNLLIIFAFTFSLLSMVSYLAAVRTGTKSWQKLARSAFLIHSISIIGIFGLLFYLILNHRFEYYYVWEHSNTEMPLRYILACFWEGQEGSFLLWMFWHIALSWVIIFTAGVWENAVMLFITMVQVFLASMVLGVVILGHKIGSNPFELLREHPDFANLPFIQLPDYLSRIKDGRGLNPLLQNYWMTIHPPTLFLGFAATVVPFAFSLAGLVRRKFAEWIVPALPWTFFGIMILGAGILMGAAWAYESLSFGGFWAWDPVENASLVPWMTLAGLGHVMLIYKHRQRSLLSAYILATVTFFLVLYSTFLTRSGILGEASVHAFTDLGMSGQLVVYMLFFLVLAVVLMIRFRKGLITKNEDEDITSREFWMFMGMLVLVIGAMQITFTTSTPVINKLFGSKMAPPADPIDHYNRWQVPVAIIISLLIGAGQFFRYRKSDWRLVLKKLALPLLLALIISSASILVLGKFPPQYFALLFASLFAVLGNLDYLVKTLKGKWSSSGASIAHMGIGLILCGALISNYKKDVISRNVKNINLGKDFPNKENIMIEEKSDTLPMGKYFVTYKGNEKQGVNVYYTIEYFTSDPATGRKIKAFELKPLVQLNERMGNVAEPATRHFLSRDIYTHITYAELEEKSGKDSDDYQTAKDVEVGQGDTIVTSNSFVIFESLENKAKSDSLHLDPGDIAVAARLKVEDINRKIYEAAPLFIIHNYTIFTQDAEVNPLGLKFTFKKINPETGKITIAVSEKKENKKEFIIMKAIIFPGINLLWTGCILMIIGSLVAVRKRIRNLKKSA